VLFYIHTALGPFSCEERAASARRRLIRIAEDPFYSEDLFSIQKTDSETRVFYRGDLVGVVTAEDAASAHQSQEELASEKIESVKEAISRYRERRAPTEWRRAQIGVAVATVALITLFLILRILHRWMSAIVERRCRAGIALRLQQQVVINPDRLARLEQRGVRLGTAATAAVLVLLYLQTVFWFVPITRRYTLALLDYLLDPIANLWQGFLANVGNLFSIFVILVLARYLLKGLQSLLLAASADQAAGHCPELGSPSLPDPSTSRDRDHRRHDLPLHSWFKHGCVQGSRDSRRGSPHGGRFERGRQLHRGTHARIQ
jgi:hypothetical protein